MKKLKKLVAIEPVSFLPEGKEEVKKYCEEVVFYDTPPADEKEIIERIGDADAIFVSYHNLIGKEILSVCPNLKYIGMCCSLYSEKSANVDIVYAREHGITVTGIKDYGDEGVAEYVTAELIQLLHGTGGYEAFFGEPSELKDVKVGILGMGATAQVIGEALSFFKADVSYYSRTRKPELEAGKGYTYKELHQLLKDSDVICSCLSKNVTLLYEEEFACMGEHTILFNTALSPSFDMQAMKHWLDKKDTYYFCDTEMGLGDVTLSERKNVFCIGKSSGMTRQAVARLNEKVLANLKQYTEQ